MTKRHWPVLVQQRSQVFSTRTQWKTSCCYLHRQHDDGLYSLQQKQQQQQQQQNMYFSSGSHTSSRNESCSMKQLSPVWFSIERRTVFSVSDRTTKRTELNKTGTATIRRYLSSASSNNNKNDDVIFPWYSESTVPSPRLQGDSESRLRNIALRHPPVMVATCFAFLDMPLYQALFQPKKFLQTLADSVGYVFPYGVQSLLNSSGYGSHTSTVVTVDDESNNLEFSFSTRNENDNSNSFRHQEDGTVKTSVGVGQGNRKDSSTSTIHPNLQQFYEAAYEKLVTDNNDNNNKTTKRNIQVHLRTQPIRAYCYSVFCIPFHTREQFQSDPATIEILQELIHRPDIGKTYEHFLSNAEKGLVETLENDEQPSFSTTVEIQVLIECEEYFHVFDVDTGTTLQGRDSTETVFHLVRLETTAKSVPTSFFSWTVTNTGWQITDIDDLANGPTAWYDCIFKKP